jgi:hypothetical protein
MPSGVRSPRVRLGQPEDVSAANVADRGEHDAVEFGVRLVADHRYVRSDVFSGSASRLEVALTTW